MIKIAANEQLPVSHPENPGIDGITISQLSGFSKDVEGRVKNAVVVSTGLFDWKKHSTWTGALDRSPCGTGTSARLALMKQKNEIDINETFISRSIIGSTFEAKIKEEFVSNNKKMIKPLIKGSAFITGKQELYVAKDDPFPEGYRLNDTWPDF